MLIMFKWDRDDLDIYNNEHSDINFYIWKQEDSHVLENENHI